MQFDHCEIILCITENYFSHKSNTDLCRLRVAFYANCLTLKIFLRNTRQMSSLPLCI